MLLLKPGELLIGLLNIELGLYNADKNGAFADCSVFSIGANIRWNRIG